MTKVTIYCPSCNTKLVYDEDFTTKDKRPVLRCTHKYCTEDVITFNNPTRFEEQS